MSIILSNEERQSTLSLLSDQQRSFILEHVKRGKKTVFANEMAKDKGIFIPEHAIGDEIEMLLEEWILEDYIDNGFVNPETPCECGRPLRYQHIVRHKSTNEVRRFGITHFEEHTNIPGDIVAAIKKGFTQIDYELDDIISKINEGWIFSEEISHIPDGLVLPRDIQQFISNEIPLLNRQIKRLKTLISEFLFEQEFQSQKVVEEEKHVPSEEEQFVFDLFEEEKPKERLPLESKLSPALMDAALKYLENVTSARIICELLIKNNHAPNKRYMSGKPKIYPLVCMYLDSLVNQGMVILSKKEGQTDRIYMIR